MAAARILSALLETRTGQQISPARSWRIESALKPLMRELDLLDLDALVARLASPGETACATHVVEALLNNETSFFRDAAVFEQIEQQVFASLRESRATMRRLRLWSAGCSTGPGCRSSPASSPSWPAPCARSRGRCRRHIPFSPPTTPRRAAHRTSW